MKLTLVLTSQFKKDYSFSALCSDVPFRRPIRPARTRYPKRGFPCAKVPFRVPCNVPARKKAGKSLPGLGFLSGGEAGIRTLDALVGHTHLAGEHLRPLGHFSVGQERIIPELCLLCQL